MDLNHPGDESGLKGGRPRGKRRGFLLLFVFLLGAGAGAALFSASAGRFDFFGLMAASPKDAQPPSASAKKEPKILYYVDPMNPSNKTDKPGTAPCGMDMVPVFEDEAEPSGADALPPGSVRISPQKQQLIGVQTVEVSERALAASVRAVGRVTVDETKISHVHTRFTGWIDQVWVDYVGKLVKKNQPLLSIYSPELFSAQQELIIAKRSKELFQNTGFEGIGEGAKTLYETTRSKLKLLEISDAQIAEIEKRGAPLKALTLNAAMDGFVTTRNAYPGQQVSPETELYTLADLSTVWVEAEVYEYEVSLIGMGQSAAVTFSSFPGKTFQGKVAYLAPELDAKTRTLKVRVELPNPGFLIKPDMYANVELKIDYGKKLAIPAEAVLDSGSARTVFVARDGGYFEPRKVTLGQRVDDLYIVLDGLQRGERVVTSANFLIDSESQLKSAVGGMGAMPDMPGMADVPDAAGKPNMADKPKAADKPGMADMPGMADEQAGHSQPAPAVVTAPPAPKSPAGQGGHAGHGL